MKEKKLFSMIKVDFRRMRTTSLFYIMLATALVIPILVLVMTTMMDGSVSVDPQTGVETVVEGFQNAWEFIGTSGGFDMSGMMGEGEASASSGMGLTTMCNINLLYFILAVFVCLFTAADFRSGYVKNLFTVRAKKSQYVASKTIVGTICGALMLLCSFVGAIIGGKIAGLSFEMDGFNTVNVVMCMISKIMIVPIFASLYTLLGVIAKQKAWLSLTLSLCCGMFFFMIIPIVTPITAGAMNVILALVGGLIFSIVLGIISNRFLKTTSLV